MPGMADAGRSEWTAVPAVGVTFHARVWDGPGTPVVLVAGLGASSRYWGRLGRRLGGRFGVLAPDLPGFGRTPAVPGARWPAGPSAGEQADQLVAWMDARGLRRAVLVGHSCGCQTAVDVVVRFPDRVERVVLAAPPFEPGRRSLAVCLPRLATGALFEVVSLPPLLAWEYGTATPARAIQQAVRTMHYPMDSVLPGVAVPTLVIHGAWDPLVSRPWAGRVAGLVRRGSLVVVERVGHAMHYSAAAVTADVIGRFLDGALDGSVPKDDPGRDAMGPPQPIPPGWHGASDYAAAAASVVLRQTVRCGPRTRRALAVAAVASGANAATTDHPAAVVRRLPMVTHAAVDAALGMGLLVAAATLRPEPPAGRRAVAALGLFHLASAILTAKPTGPARPG